uniref:(northern house mosquito) hypothetical protein n=1 Tax=Culex pipiens TaxID=7175 RepID=A0A8D8MQT7_CULPI
MQAKPPSMCRKSSFVRPVPGGILHPWPWKRTESTRKPPKSTSVFGVAQELLTRSVATSMLTTIPSVKLSSRSIWNRYGSCPGMGPKLESAVPPDVGRCSKTKPI